MIRGVASCGGSLSFNGTFSTTGATATVTSATRNVVTGGTAKFDGLGEVGTPAYSKNGAAFNTITEGETVSLAAGDTLALRATSLPSPGVCTFSLRDNLGSRLIESVALERT